MAIALMAIALMAIALMATSCRFSVGRARSGVPLDTARYETMSPGATTRAEALEELGAPDAVRWENGESRLSWHHIDTTFFQARAQLPLVQFFGYRHDLLRYFQNREQSNTIDLVFDEDGVLERKSLRLADAYRDEPGTARRRYFIEPKLERSLLLLGDADAADYDDLFDDGFLAGIQAGIQPIAPLHLGVVAAYQHYPGRTLSSQGSVFAFDDLELFSLEALIRVQLPLSILFGERAAESLWDTLIDADPAHHDGWILYAEATLGTTLNGKVPVWIDGARSGSLFDARPRLSNSATLGVEYGMRHASLRLGVGLRTTDGFSAGDSPLRDDAGALQTLMASAEFALKF